MSDAAPRPGLLPAESMYVALDRVLVRAPTLPVESYLALSGEAPPTAGTALGGVDPLRSAAVAVASPDLFEQLQRADRSESQAQRIAGKLLRYGIRMATRPTPFGMFAGIGMARLGGATDLRLGPGLPRTRTRPDMDWLLAFIARLEEQPRIRRELHMNANPAVWIKGDRAVLAEKAGLAGGGHATPVGIRATGAVRRALDASRTPVPWSRLASSLLATPGATEEKVDALLTELWRQTFLFTELRPALTHPAPARQVEERLAAIVAAEEPRAILSALLDEMAAWDQMSVERRPASLASLRRLAVTAVPGHTGDSVQVDTALALEGAVVSARVGAAAARAADLLLRLGSPPAAGRLDSYLHAYVDRYGADREVELLALLDPDVGLGPPAGRALGPPDVNRHVTFHTTLLRLAAEALRMKRLVVDLDETAIAELTQYSPDAATAPLSVDLSVFVLARSAAAIDEGDFSLLVGPNLGAQAAGRNLGRFVDLLGEQAREAVRAVAEAEIAFNPGDLHAELAYLPRRGRSANVAVRPSAYPYEVVVGTAAGVDPHCAIPLSELLVGVDDGRFYVRWTKAPGNLHVHAGHMLTSHLAPDVCNFLEDVTRGNRVFLTPLQWGAAADLPFLPRVQVGNIVLSPARWRLDPAARDADLPPDDHRFPELLTRWRSDRLVPRRVYLTDGDNRLLLDLEAPAQADQLREELRRMRRGVVVLQEPLPGPEHAWLEGPDGHHLPELVVSLVQRARESPAEPRPTRPAQRLEATLRGERLRAPGSDWLFAKLYGPKDGQDELIAGAVRNLGEFAVGSGLADRWFFLRYGDPEPHLRLRFAGEPARLLGDLLPKICDWAQELISAGSCSRLAFDTYEREIERYGGVEAMTSVEAVFAADSAAVPDLLHLGRTAQSLPDRTELAVLSVDSLLDGLGLDAGARAALYRDAVVSRRTSAAEYRRRKQILRRLLGEPAAGQHEPELGRILGARRAALSRPAGELRRLAGAGGLVRSLDEICRSIVHLHCNRLLGTEPPSEQLVLGLLLRTREGLERAPLT